VIQTIYFGCELPHTMADSLNAESGRIYTQVMVEHYRIYRKTGTWLSPKAQERLNDFYNAGQQPLLHAHSIDAAQQGFSKACKTTKVNRGEGAHYPHRRKRYRTTIWKSTGMRLKEGFLLLALARGNQPIKVELPELLKALPDESFTEMRLVYNIASRHYEWHLVVDDGVAVQPSQDTGVAAGDLGEIHPITLTDGADALVISCRQLRAQNQHTNYVLAKMRAKQARHQKGSRRSRRLIQRKVRFLAKQARRKGDIEHKVCRAAVDWCVEHQVGTLALGDVRDIADGKRLNKKSQQKISNWSHGKIRTFIGYKAEAVGITVIDNVDEAYTSQTCTSCSHKHKPKGRVYTCPACGFCGHRDVVGASNILSRFLYDDLGKVRPPETVKYRHPVLRGKRSSPGHGASSSKVTR
jgi:putative transposase